MSRRLRDALAVLVAVVLVAALALLLIALACDVHVLVSEGAP